MPVLAKSSGEKVARRLEKVRAQLAKLGTGSDARIKVELRDKTKLEGYMGEAGTESFVIVNKAGVATTIAYPQVVKAKGNNLSTGAKIAIGTASVRESHSSSPYSSPPRTTKSTRGSQCSRITGECPPTFGYRRGIESSDACQHYPGSCARPLSHWPIN
ncbi:MAG TPA: hypothetical protein VFM05_11820 [Candidatus Saccharimonadales bacterium]|nr:hypothetical protein [Candidatus Saccharimonadales bacterium]